MKMKKWQKDRIAYDRELPVEIINLYDYEFIAKRSMDVSYE